MWISSSPSTSFTEECFPLIRHNVLVYARPSAPSWPALLPHTWSGKTECLPSRTRVYPSPAGTLLEGQLHLMGHILPPGNISGWQFQSHHMVAFPEVYFIRYTCLKCASVSFSFPNSPVGNSVFLRKGWMMGCNPWTLGGTRTGVDTHCSPLKGGEEIAAVCRSLPALFS